MTLSVIRSWSVSALSTVRTINRSYLSVYSSVCRFTVALQPLSDHRQRAGQTLYFNLTNTVFHPGKNFTIYVYGQRLVRRQADGARAAHRYVARTGVAALHHTRSEERRVGKE